MVSAGKNPAFVHESSYVDEGVILGEGTSVWHFSHIQPKAKIGKNCSIGQNVNIGPSVIIGDGCKIQNNVSIYTGVTLESNVFCGPSCVFTNDLFPRATQDSDWVLEETYVEEGASIGANATIVCGIRIGKHALVAAGSVVTSNVPPHALVIGAPAKVVAWVCECGRKLDSSKICSYCNKKWYHLPL
jgi:UDP-2-acetamido-3-amino-2,3-dideoxy-glucuronate N-acetyltransferase